MKLFAVYLCLFRWIFVMRTMGGNHNPSITQIITMIVVRAPPPVQEAELVLHFHIIFVKITVTFRWAALSFRLEISYLNCDLTEIEAHFRINDSCL